MVIWKCILVRIISLPNSLQKEVSIMFPSTHASVNLPMSSGVTNSVRQKGAAPLALSDILQLVTTVFHALKLRQSNGIQQRRLSYSGPNHTSRTPN